MAQAQVPAISLAQVITTPSNALSPSNLYEPSSVAVDAAGNVYVGESCQVMKATPAGVITMVAGTGTGCGYNGDGVPATAAELYGVWGVALDAAGNLYIADSLNGRIRKVWASTGVITTVAGGGTGGDGGPATSAALSTPYGVAVDAAGNLYISDYTNYRIRRVDASTGVITTVAGNGTQGYGGDGGPATSANLGLSTGVAVDAAGNLYIADTFNNNRIRKVTASTGVITTIAGTGSVGYSGDGGPATGATLDYPYGLAVDTAGNVYIADSENNRIRRVDASTGLINTVAGNGTIKPPPYSGDGGLATNASLNTPRGVALDAAGNLYIADSLNSSVRLVNNAVSVSLAATLVSPYPYYYAITTMYVGLNQPTAVSFSIPPGYGGLLSGIGFNQDFSFGVVSGCVADGTTVNAAGTLCSINVTFKPSAPGYRSAPFVAVDGHGTKYSFGISGQGTGANFVFNGGIASTLAGNGSPSYSGDGGVGTAASLNNPGGAIFDLAGNTYIADTANQRIRKVDSTGNITTIAGNGVQGYGGDNGQALLALLSNPSDVVVDAAGNTYIADSGNQRVRVVDLNGAIKTLAGNGSIGFGGDGGPAQQASLNNPLGLAIDNLGNLYIADSGNHCIRRVSEGYISTIAGLGTAGFSGDGGLAVSAELDSPTAITLDQSGNLFVADTANNRIRRVDAITGIITTVAGNGSTGFAGDGGNALTAMLNQPSGVAVDLIGQIYIADTNNAVIRKVDGASIITTVAGTGVAGYSGDGLASPAQFNAPRSLRLHIGDLIITDQANNRVRRVSLKLGPLAFPNTSVGQTSAPETIEATNSGNSVLHISGYFLQSGNATIDSSATTCPYSGTVNVGATCTFALLFSPQTGGNVNVPILNIADDGTGDDGSYSYYQTLWVSGYAADVSTTTSITVGSSPVYYGGQSVVNVTVTPQLSQFLVTGSVNVFDNGTNIGTVSLEDYNSGSISQQFSVGTHILTATYQGNLWLSPSTSGPATLIVVNAPPTITWPTPPTITYGAALNATELNATASVLGTFAYTPPAGTVLGAGTQLLSVAFTPTDSTDYATATKTVLLTVNKVTPTLSLSSSNASSPYGALVTFTTTISSGPTGTVTFYDGGTSIGSGSISGTTATFTTSSLAAGLHSITASWAGNSNYSSANSTAITQTVTQATPTITWSAPAAITYGTALTATQLNATATVQGTFAYTPALGIVPGAGTQTLSVTFTPTDGTDYQVATRTVSLTVNKATPTLSMSSSNASSIYGVSVTFTATISSGATGTVTFYDGGTSIGTGSISGTTATFIASSLTAGSHSVSASWAGNSNYNSLNSAAITQTVTQATPTITWSSPTTIAYGAALNGAQLNATASVPGNFTYTPAAGAVLSAGTQSLSVTFTPTDGTDYTLAIKTVSLTVSQTTPVISWTAPSAVTYGTGLNSAQLNATASVPGTFAYSPTTGAVLGAGTQSLLATFTPTDATDYTSATKTVSLTVSQATPIVSWAAPTAITYGAALSATQLNATASVPGIFTYTPVTGTVLGAGTQSLLATFTPTDTIDYTTAAKTVSLTVNKATPTLTIVSSTAGSVYGASVTLTATISTGPAGTVTFYDGGNSIGTGSISGNTATFTTSLLAAGSHSITASWAGNSNYNSANSTGITQTVTQVMPTVTWSTPTAIAYGTALNSAQLNATASVLGSFTYLPAAGTVLGAGTQTLSATFMPTDTTDYTTATKSVSLMVGQATPIITWSAPAAITFGTALSATQLNATASVTGTFAYTPAAGTVLGVGTQTLSVTFTPNDTIDYNTATDTVSLTVNKDTTTATVSIANSATLGASVTLMAAVSPASSTGTVTFKNGSTTLGTGTLSGGTASMTLAATTANGFAVGSNSISAVYAGDNNDSGSTSSAATLTVTEGTTTTVTASPSSIALGSSSSTQNLTATVTTTSGTPTGTVTFKVGSVTVGSAPLSSGGATVSVAPTTANGFTVGSDTVTASYAPATGSGFIASSGTQTLTVNAPAYTIAPASTSLSLSKGGSQSDTVTLASTTFADTTSWTATASSPLITVSPSSGTAMLSANGSSTASLTITASSSAANHAPRLPWTGGLIAFGAVLAGVPLARRRKRVLAVLLTTLAILTLAFMMSCGGGGGSSTPTPPVSPRSYTVTISGTGGVSSTIAVTVQ